MEALMGLLARHLSAGEPLALCTVVARSGSAPRGSGARMLVGRAGRLWGTVGGGLIEHQAERLAAQVLADGQSILRAFCLDADRLESLGMVCGGDVTLAIQYLPGGDAGLIDVARQAQDWLSHRRDGWLVAGLEGSAQPLELLSPQAAAERYPSLCGALCLFGGPGQARFAQRLSPAGTVYLFGGGHVARELSPLLARLDFRHVVMDDRPEFSLPADFPGAAQVLQVDFEAVLDAVSPGPADYAVVMTRGHGFDLTVQRQLLTTPVGYIGVMGSRKKKAFVFGRLKEAGFTDADLARIVTPIGLPLGGETPAEIALSVAAQLVQLRAGKGG